MEKMLPYIPKLYPDIEVVESSVKDDHIHMVTLP